MGGTYDINFYKEASQFKLEDCKRIVDRFEELGADYNQKLGYWSDENSDSVIGNLDKAINAICLEGGDINLVYQNIHFKLSIRFKGYTDIKRYGAVGLFVDRVYFRRDRADRNENFLKFLTFVEETFNLVKPVYVEAYYETPRELITDKVIDKLERKKKSLDDLKKK